MKARRSVDATPTVPMTHPRGRPQGVRAPAGVARNARMQDSTQTVLDLEGLLLAALADLSATSDMAVAVLEQVSDSPDSAWARDVWPGMAAVFRRLGDVAELEIHVRELARLAGGRRNGGAS